MRAFPLVSVLFAVLSTASLGQIAMQRPPVPKPPQKPNVFVPNTVVDAGAYRPTPAEMDAARNPVPRNIGVSWDRKGWVTSVDGKATDIVFSPGSEHVVRGKGLDGLVQAFITSSRLPRGRGNQIKTVGSVLTPVRQSDTEIVFRVSRIAAGQIPWSSSGERQHPNVRLKLRTNGGGRYIEADLRRSTYRCVRGDANCE